MIYRIALTRWMDEWLLFVSFFYLFVNNDFWSYERRTLKMAVTLNGKSWEIMENELCNNASLVSGRTHKVPSTEIMAANRAYEWFYLNITTLCYLSPGIVQFHLRLYDETKYYCKYITNVRRQGWNKRFVGRGWERRGWRIWMYWRVNTLHYGNIIRWTLGGGKQILLIKIFARKVVKKHNEDIFPTNNRYTNIHIRTHTHRESWRE